MPGPAVRTDIVDVYVFRRCDPLLRSGGVEFLQLRRAVEPLRDTWQPVMGHIEPGETAVAAALRELREETGFAPPLASPDSQGQAEGFSPGCSLSSPPSSPLDFPSPTAATPPPRTLLNFWQLESVWPFFLAALDAVMLCPCFAAEVAPPPEAEPILDHTHSAHRWVPRDHADRCFLWPGQRHALAQIQRDLLDPASPVASILRIPS